VKGRGAARPYARALHDLARERGEVEGVLRELEAVAATLAEAPELREVLARPWVPTAAKRNLAVEIAQRLGVSALTRDFLALVARHGRAHQIAAIVEAYRSLVDEALGRARARVRTAVPLTEDERGQIRARLARALGVRDVLVEEIVDAALLGGFVAEVGSYLVDASLDGQLARLRERLAGAAPGT
jgi:F-type H+-transporting ATPase subunit delta